MKNKKSGIILIDVILALTLVTIFVAGITASSFDLNEIFLSAKEKNALLDIFELHKSEFSGLLPYEMRSITYVPENSNYSTTTINAHAHWYGNDQIQTDIEISSETYPSTLRKNKIVFNKIDNYLLASINSFIGTPLCSVDYTSNTKLGSYIFNNISNSHYNFQLIFPTIIPIQLPINPLLPLTDIEVRNDIAYVSSDSTNASDPDIFVFDISKVDDARIISSINTGPGIASIVLAQNHIYAAAASSAAQLHIIRFDDVYSPIIEKKYQLPLPFATATPAFGSSVFYNNNHVFLGTTKWDDQEFSIINVTDPTDLIRIGGFETNSQINDIYVRDKVVYISDSDQQQLRILDISDFTNPNMIESFTPSGWKRQQGKNLSYFEDNLNFARTSGGFNIKNDHELFSWATTSIINSQLNSSNIDQQFSVDISGGVYGSIQDRHYVYVVTRQLGKEFQIFDNHLSTTTSKSFSLPSLPQTITCDNDYLYVLSHTAPVIYKISFK